MGDARRLVAPRFARRFQRRPTAGVRTSYATLTLSISCLRFVFLPAAVPPPTRLGSRASVVKAVTSVPSVAANNVHRQHRQSRPEPPRNSPCKSSAAARSTTSASSAPAPVAGWPPRCSPKRARDVVMLEAGPMWDPSRTRTCSTWTYDSPRRGARDREAAVRRVRRRVRRLDARRRALHERAGQPASTGSASRMLGGRTNHWGRISLRFGPDDFRRKSLDGLGDDWPITYDDMKPYYDRVDSFVGIFGSEGGLAERSRRHLPAAAQAALLRAADQAGRGQAEDHLHCQPAVDSDAAAERPDGVPLLRPVRPRLRDALELLSPSVLIPPAMATEQLTHRHQRDGARGHRRRRRPRDRRVLHRQEHRPRQSRAGADRRARRERVRVGAAFSSTRSRRSFPQGLGNSSGNVGKYLTDTTGAERQGFIPKLMNGVPHNEDGVGGMHVFMPWWLDNKKLDFPRGYHIELGGGRGMPASGSWAALTITACGAWEPRVGGYGKSLKDDYRRFYGATVDFSGRGEMIPNKDSYWRSIRRRRQVGHSRAAVPLQVLRLRDQPGEAHAGDLPRPHRRRWAARRCGDADAGARTTAWRRAAASSTSSASTRMGNDPNTSVLNKNCQAHDCRTSSSPTPGRSCRSPTRTARGRSWRCRCGRASSSPSERKAGKAVMDEHQSSAAAQDPSAAPVAASFALTEAEAQQAHHLRRGRATDRETPGSPNVPKFFTATEYQTVRVLSDLIIPADERSGGAIDAGVPEFMDFTMVDQPARQVAMRGGLAWLDLESQRRFDKTFVGASDADRRLLLDDLSNYGKPIPGLTHGQSFFRSFRDLTATGFWTTKMGFTDLGYIGNTVVPKWDGCPPEQLKKLGL